MKKVRKQHFGSTIKGKSLSMQQSEGMEKDNPEAVSKNGLICGNVRASCGKF